ncbi:uncharacterized protein IL334_002842 [Kwoniella shivajii]|uniref:Cryptic loci regulator 2 N-terminal domain-containing protein n=1 Tax=Kwoniella shivajii TaxID=564305 RepID=A0ABZ1CVU3_9TREE|nr:hypothetical protein IL334_002842 [Kwoniella shivajii]
MSKPSHPSLAWPRSDGDPSRWPDTTHRPGDDSWHEEAPVRGTKIDLYETKIAEQLAVELRLKVDPTRQRIPMPDGYKLFAHKKKQPGGDIRTDYYLYGSPDILKFRSVPEFADHAIWLFDTSKPLDDHSTCTCKYSKGAGRRQSMPGSATKRPSGSSPLKEGTLKKKRVVQEDEDSLPAVVPDRAEELRSQRRFRELIWFRINTITPPLSIAGLEPITHWPGLISNVPLKTRVIGDTASASASSAWTLFGGSAPSTLDASTIVHYYEYHIRPLGMFSPQEEVIKDGKDILPWQVGNELLGGERGWDSIGNHAEKVLKEGVQKEAVKEKGKPKDEIEATLGRGWKGHWAKRIKFVEMSREYEDAVFRLSVALKTASSITNSWAQTDKIDVLPDNQDISADDMAAILDQKKTLYQKNRKDLPSSALLSPTEGATERGVFFKIRVIAVEVNPGSAKPDQTAWRCLLYGDIFELAKEGDATQLPTPNSAIDSSKDSLNVHYQSAKGFVYRQLNETDSEVTVDVIDVAGRVYHDLLDGATQSWFIDPSKPSDKEGRIQPGESALALVGLKSGTTVASKSTDWEEDLYGIVQKTTKTTETQMKGYYTDLLREELGLPKLNGVDGQVDALAGSS